MPIFIKKLQPKQCPQRTSRLPIAQCPKIEESLEDFEDISMDLNGTVMTFKDGTWGSTNTTAVPSASGAADLTRMKKKLNQLEEENNLNKVKVDVLLDMLTENVCELKNGGKK
jgi:protein chibby 1